MTYLPAPSTGIPAPRSLLFPAPTAPQDPMFGVNPFSTGNMYQPSFVDPSVGLPDLQQRAAQQAQLMQMAQLSSLGLAPETDPHTWTPEEATRQTDQALAKIATVDPEAAQRLAEQRAPTEDNGDSFWDNLKQVAGDILAPGLELGGRILDIVGRTANIIPNLAFDAVNGGDFNFFGDIGGALSGNVRHNWNSVFQEMGWEGDGISGFLRATIGLVGDIGTDPLTWLIPAGAGAKAADAAATTARTAATRASSITERAAAYFGKTGDELVTHLETAYDDLVKGARNKGWKPGAEGEDIVSGLIATHADEGARELLSDMMLISDRTYRGVRARGLSTWAQKGSITLSDGSVLQGKQLLSSLEEVIKAGSFSGKGLAVRGSAEWKQARQLASALGGARLKVNLPFTNLRYISKSLPYSKLATEKTVGFVTRALAGQGGMNRMLSAIGKGEGTWDDLTTWMEDGFNAAFDKNPEMVRNLRGRFKNMGSMYYSMSEMMGSITYHFDAGARATRTGLAGYMANAERLEAQSAYNRVVREIAYESKGVSGTRRDRQQWLRTAEGTLGMSFRKKGMVATEQQQADFTNFMDWFPSELDTSDAAAVDAWFWAKPENQGVRLREAGGEAGVGASELAKAEAKLAKMHETLSRLEPQQQLFLRDTQEMYHNVRLEMAKRDAVTGSVRHNYDRAGVLMPDQATEWQVGSHPLLEQDFYVDVTGDAGRANRVGYNGFGEADLAEHDGIVGIRASRTSGGGRGTSGVTQQRVRAKGGDWVIIDETPGATMSDDAWIHQVRDETDVAAVDSEVARAEATDGVKLPVAGDLDTVRTSAEMTTAAIRKNRPDASGVLYKRANGDVELVVFDPANIKSVSDSAAHLVPSEAGYYHRAFSKKVKEWLRGKVPTTERQLLIAEPEVEGYLARATLGMDLDEADDFVRTWLTDVYGAEAAATLPPSVWNRNMLEVHEEYLSHAGEAVAAEMLGNASRRMVMLGDLQPAMFGSTPRSAKYEWMLHPNLVKTLAKKDKKLTAAVMHMHELDAKRMEEQHARLSAVAEEYGMFQAQVEEALANGTEVPNRFVQSVRRYGATVADADHAITTELGGIETQTAALREQLDSYDSAFASVSTDPAYGHPGADEAIRIVDNPDGTQTILGWHARIDPGTPQEAVFEAAPQGAEMSNAGFHMGNLNQAETRAEALAGSMDKTIGHRAKPEEWDQTVTFQGAAPDGGDLPIDVRPHELVVKKDGTLYSPPLTWEEAARKAAGLDETAVAMGTTPIPPDLFFEDIVYPVQVTGKFHGAAEGEPILREGRDLSGVFTGSPSDWSATKATAIGQYQGEGFDGIIYANTVEYAGDAAPGLDQSVVLFNPNATNASGLTVAKGPQRFADDVAAGKLYRQADGSVSARRTAGSKKLMVRTDIEDQLDELEARSYELGGLRRNLHKGDDTVVPNTRPAQPRFKVDITDEGGSVTAKTSDGYVRASRNGADLEVMSSRVANKAQRQGQATSLYLRLAELADAQGGRLISDIEGQVSPEAVHFWEGLRKKGYHVTVEEFEDGGRRYVLQHEGLPNTRNVATAGASVARTATRNAERLGQNMLSAGKRLERLRRQTQLAMGEANKAYAEFHGARAATQPALVRIETAGGMEGLTRLRVPGLEGYAMPHYVAAEFHNAIDQYGAQGLQKAWRTYVMGPWKRWATYRWPGFHVRNFFGAFFNNWLGGVDLPDYVFSWRVNHARDGALKWANREVDTETIKRLALDRHFGAGYAPTYGEVADLLSEQGIGRANTVAVMGIEGGSMAAHEMYSVAGHKNPNAFRRAARKFDGVMREAGSSVEDFHRVAAWATGMSATSGDTYGARAFVMMRHGDYSDLTHAEQYIKDVIPFYKWMRTNVPYQLRMLAENPAKLTLVHDKLKRYAFEAQGLDYEKSKLQMPDYLQESLAIPIPSWVPVVGSKDKDALKFALFDLPYADLYNGLDEYLSSALPIGRNVLESYGFKQTLFSGTPLTGEYKPLSGVFNVPGIRDILHAAKLTKRGADGQEYIEDRLQNVLLAWPIFSRFRNFTESSPDRVDSRVGGIFSMVAGVGVKQGDFTNAELDFFYNEVQPLLDQYRSLGIQLPTVDDFQSGSVGAQVNLFGPQETVVSPLFGQAA